MALLVSLLVAPGWVIITIGIIAFIALVWGGIKLSVWFFKRFFPDLFHEGEKRWDEKP